MGRSNQLNTLLVEIMIAVLFFALSATVILQTFVITRNQSRQAGIYDEALMLAQNMADELYVADDYTAVLQSAGYAQEDEGWTLRMDEYYLRVTASEEEMAAGVMFSAEVRAFQADELLLTLPCLRYVPGEVQP